MAASNLDLCPIEVNLCFARGDTFPWTFTLKDSAGIAVDITGFGFKLTVDPSAEPSDNTANLFQLTGTVTNGPGGVVRFAMSAINSDQLPGVYFFDLEMTDGTAAIRTIAKGQFEFEQDITKA